MPLTALALGWAAVTAWYLAWAAGARRWQGEPGPAPAGWIDPDWRLYMVESALLTLLAALWFGSLGRGGWVLLFSLIGATSEWAIHARGSGRPVGWPGARRLAGVARTVVAGGLLRWIL